MALEVHGLVQQKFAVHLPQEMVNLKPVMDAFDFVAAAMACDALLAVVSEL